MKKEIDYYSNLDYSTELESTIHKLIAYGREMEKEDPGSGVRLLLDITQAGKMNLSMMLKIKEAIENPDAEYKLINHMNKDSIKQRPLTPDECYKFDINRKDLYEFGRSDLKERTKNRLIQIAEIGMEEVSVAQFGIKDIMSGLYIENIWSYSDEAWEEYVVWVNSLIKIKKAENNLKGKAPIVRHCDGFIILAHDEKDFNIKARKIYNGDTAGFYTIEKALNLKLN